MKLLISPGWDLKMYTSIHILTLIPSSYTSTLDVIQHWRRKRGELGGLQPPPPPKFWMGGRAPLLEPYLLLLYYKKYRFGISHHVKFHEQVAVKHTLLDLPFVFSLLQPINACPTASSMLNGRGLNKKVRVV